MVGRLVGVALAAAVVVGAGFARPEAAPVAPVRHARQTPLLGLVYGYPSATLARVDPATLRVLLGPRLPVGNHVFAWSFSADRSRLALGGDRNNLAIPELLLVDARRLTALGRVQVATKGELRGTTWLPGGRVLAVVDGWDAGTIVATVGVEQRRVVARRTLAGTPLHVEPSGAGVAILLAASRAIAPARLAVVRPSGTIDVAVLGRPAAGSRRTGSATGAEFQSVAPALAVDRARGRAFVIGAGADAAEVELGSMAVTYRRISPSRSLLGRLAAWLEPAAEAKSIEGPQRFARWLGGGLVAVSGGDYAVEDGRRRLTFTPAGVRLIDTRTWRARSVAPGADSFRVVGGLVLGTSTTWSSELQPIARIGLSAYRLDGREHFHLYRGQRVWMAHADATRAYVDLPGPGRIEVVELATGRVVERRSSVAVPLAGDDAWSSAG